MNTTYSRMSGSDFFQSKYVHSCCMHRCILHSVRVFEQEVVFIKVAFFTGPVNAHNAGRG